MAYLVRTMPRAERDLDAIFGYIGADTSPAALKWYARLIAATESLSGMPLRNPRAPEDPELRQLLFGNKPHIYRVVYFVDEPRQRVNILHVRHHSRDAFTPPDLL
ncbi:MAG: type II toxin-antitoxin system RelE/ParE family toxin [Acidobacteriaceae bacterium]